MVDIVAFDTETFLIGPKRLPPRFVCLSVADGDGAHLFTNHDPATVAEVVKHILSRESVGHNVAFDLAVLAAYNGELLPLIWDALQAGRVHDTRIREKLLNLASHGRLDFVEAPDGTKRPISYRLDILEQAYLGVDRSDEKDGDDVWRMNYSMLSGLPAEDYPDEAARYAKQDAELTREVYLAQEKRAAELTTEDVFATETLHVCAAFALHLMTCWGIEIDPVEVAKLEEFLKEELDPAKHELLYTSGILSMPIPAKPYARQEARALELLGLSEFDWDDMTEQQQAWLEENGIKFKKAVPTKKSTKALKELVERVSLRNDITPKRTDPSDRNPEGSISTDAEVLERIAHLDPVLEQYKHWQSLQKLVTTELPRFFWEDELVKTVHPSFDVLKESGRTSSYADKLFPSANIQQIDPRARACYKARDGYVLCSTDYNGLELASTAQKTYTLFGQSAMRDAINAGMDLHANTGAFLAYHKDGGFRALVDEERADRYTRFKSLEETIPEFYEHWRKFAKPVNLGNPGGLGAETFVQFARTTYGVHLTEDEAREFKEHWLNLYPEMREYFQWVNRHCKDPLIPDSYCYVSPMGMIRRGASYTSVCNGAAMQTPSAEGAKLATFLVSRACYDSRMGSVLYGCRPLAFIHDELIVEMPRDNLMHERAAELSRIMVDSMQSVMPDVTIRTESALMVNWSKKAKPVFENDRLAIWFPKVAA